MHAARAIVPALVAALCSLTPARADGPRGPADIVRGQEKRFEGTVSFSFDPGSHTTTYYKVRDPQALLAGPRILAPAGMKVEILELSIGEEKVGMGSRSEFQGRSRKITSYTGTGYAVRLVVRLVVAADCGAGRHVVQVSLPAAKAYADHVADQMDRERGRRRWAWEPGTPSPAPGDLGRFLTPTFRFEAQVHPSQAALDAALASRSAARAERLRRAAERATFARTRTGAVVAAVLGGLAFVILALRLLAHGWRLLFPDHRIRVEGSSSGAAAGTLVTTDDLRESQVESAPEPLRERVAARSFLGRPTDLVLDLEARPASWEVTRWINRRLVNGREVSSWPSWSRTTTHVLLLSAAVGRDVRPGRYLVRCRAGWVRIDVTPDACLHAASAPETAQLAA